MKHLTAWLNLRLTLPERVDIFRQGLERVGYRVVIGIPREPKECDLFCTWNRIGSADYVARMMETVGLPVIVTENASWGNEFAGDRWYSLARNFHNMAGQFPIGDASRWDGLGVDLAEWRTSGETVVLPQRGIGPPEVAMPRGWPGKQCGRIRPHPGRFLGVPLEKDLAKAGKVVTWGSGAAIKALIWGIPVESHMPRWIGDQNNEDAGRLAMFRSLSWAQWRHSEISNGEVFARMLA